MALSFLGLQSLTFSSLCSFTSNALSLLSFQTLSLGSFLGLTLFALSFLGFQAFALRSFLSLTLCSLCLLSFKALALSLFFCFPLLALCLLGFLSLSLGIFFRDSELFQGFLRSKSFGLLLSLFKFAFSLFRFKSLPLLSFCLLPRNSLSLFSLEALLLSLCLSF